MTPPRKLIRGAAARLRDACITRRIELARSRVAPAFDECPTVAIEHAGTWAASLGDIQVMDGVVRRGAVISDTAWIEFIRRTGLAGTTALAWAIRPDTTDRIIVHATTKREEDIVMAFAGVPDLVAQMSPVMIAAQLQMMIKRARKHMIEARMCGALARCLGPSRMREADPNGQILLEACRSASPACINDIAIAYVAWLPQMRARDAISACVRRGASSATARARLHALLAAGIRAEPRARAIRAIITANAHGIVSDLVAAGINVPDLEFMLPANGSTDQDTV